MEELIKKCKCSVSLEVNKYRDFYQTVQDYLNEKNERGGIEIEEELGERMIKEQSVYELQFYPDTPIGFYVVYGTSLEEVIAKANECLITNP